MAKRLLYPLYCAVSIAIFNSFSSFTIIEFITKTTSNCIQMPEEAYLSNDENYTKLVKLGSNVPSINVTNSTPAVKAEGFKETNIYDGTITAGNVETVLKEMYNFSWNGELLYDEDRDVEDSANFSIAYIPADKVQIDTDKVVIQEIVFAIDYFDDCVANTAGGVTNNADGNYQLYTLKKRITIKMD